MQRAAPNGADSAEQGRITPEAFATKYLDRVYRFAVMVSPLRVDADDLAQEAMVRALASLGRFDPSRGTIDGWLWRIVVNLARDAGRMAGRTELLIERLAAQRGGPLVEVSGETAALARLRNHDLVDAIRRLPRRYRSLIALRYGAGLSSIEIAALLGTTQMAVIKAMHRALARLRKELEGQRDAEGN